MRTVIGLLAALWICPVIPSTAADNSPLEYAGMPYYPQTWRWEPVGKLAPESVRAVAGARAEQGRQLTLEPGGAALFRLPAGYWLRLAAAGEVGGLPPSDTWYTRGNGLFVPAPLQQGREEGEWLLPPVGSSGQFLRLENSGAEAVRWWLSRARPDSGAPLYPYRDVVPAESDAAQWYRQVHRGNHLQLSRLQPGDDYTVVLQGPGEWRLEARTLAERGRSWQRFVDLSVRLDERYWRDWRLHPRINHRELLESAQCRELASDPEYLYLTLPAGEHRVSFTAPQSLVVRTLALSRDDYLFTRNQPLPSAAELTRQFRLHGAPAASPAYDEQLFTALLGGDYPRTMLPQQFDQVTHSLASRRAAVQLVQRRYQFWRSLPVAGVEHAPGDAELIDVALPDPLRGKHRYLLPSAARHSYRTPLLRLAPGQSVELDAPGQQRYTTLKLTLPVSSMAYDLFLKNRRGETTVWRWRPAMIQSQALDVVSDRDLSRLATLPEGSDVASASASFTLAREDFPVSVSHNADRVIWFSPFYRDDVQPALDQAGWEHALEELGTDHMLELLLSDKRPEPGQTPTGQEQLRLKVWDDWQPLRRWLRSYRQIWEKGLVAGSPTVDAAAYEPLPGLIARLDGQADHLLAQFLKGVAVKDPAPARRAAALHWLHAHYAEAGDTANLSAWYSWQFHHAPGEQLQALADWLLGVELEAMALRLYRLAETPASHLPYQQARLDAGWQSRHTAPSALIDTWEAVWRKDWGGAREHSLQLERGHPWRAFLDRAPAGGDPVSWLQWAQQAPDDAREGVPGRIAARLTPGQSAGRLHFYVKQRGLHMQRSVARPDTPVRYTVIGPVDLQLAVSLHHSDPLEVLSDWIEIDDNGVKRWLPVFDSKANPAIEQLPHPGLGYIGAQRRVTLSLGPGRHELRIRPLEHDSLVDARIRSPLLLANLVSDLQAGRPVTPADTYTASELVSDLDITVLNDCDGAAAAGDNTRFATGDGDNRDRHTVPEATRWSAPHTLADGGGDAGELHTPDGVEQFLLNLLWQWPRTGDEARQRQIARANAVALPYRDRAAIRSLLSKLNRDYSWRLEETITASAGSRRVAVSGTTENPVVAEREKLFLDGTPPPGERLYGYKRIGFFTRFATPTKVRFILRQEHLPYRQAPPARVVVTLNDEPLHSVSLPPLQQQFTVTVPAGPQQLRLQLEQASTDHWLYVQALARLSGRWQSLLEQKSRRYQVATQQQPVEIYLSEPRWLRIDEYRDGGVSRRYQWQAEAGLLHLHPPSDRATAMYRVFSWRQDDAAPPLQPYRFEMAQHEAVADDQSGPQMTGIPISPEPDYQWSPDLRLQGTARSTDGLYLQLKSRLDLDTDASGDDDEQFAEAGWRHRRALDCPGCYWRSDLFARVHEDDDIEVAGTHQWLHGDWAQSSWRWELKQSLWLQTEPETDWAWQGTAAAIDRHDINEKLEHEYKLEVFGRYLSADDPDYPVDNDVYTRYKDQHRHGLRLGATLRGRPWLDSLWTANAGLSTNEDFNPLDPDYVQASVAWRQYWRPLAFSGVYRHRIYLSDDDRDSRLHRPALGLAVNALTAFPAGQLLQWGARLDYDLDRGEYGFMLSVNWDHTRGRGLRDFYPGRSSFHSLRSRDIGDNLFRHQMINGQSDGE